MAKITQTEIITAIEKALEVQPGSVNETTHARDIAAWDSLGHLNVLVALDRLLEGKVANIQEMAEIDSVGKILSVLSQRSLI